MNSHTPGPWKNGRSPDGKSVIFQVAPQPAIEFYVEPVNEEWRANMRLLDAAPDMLNALKNIRDVALHSGVTPERATTTMADIVRCCALAISNATEVGA